MLAFLAAASPVVVEVLPSWTIAWSLSPDRRFAVTLTKDGLLDVWFVDRDRPRPSAHLIHRFQTPPWSDWSGGASDFVAVAPGGTYVCVRRPEGGFDVRRALDGRVVRHIEVNVPGYKWETAWTPAANRLLIDAGREPSPLAPPRSRLVTLGTGKTRDLPIAPPWVFSPDGKSVLGSTLGGLALVDLATGRVRRRFADASASFAPYAFSPDGRYLATAGEDPDWRGPQSTEEYPVPTESAYFHQLKTKVWRVADGRRIRMLEGGFNTSDEDWIAFADRRRLVISGKLLDVVTGHASNFSFRPAIRVTGYRTLPNMTTDVFHRRPVLFPEGPALGEKVAASPDGQLLVVPEFSPLALRGETRLLVWSLPERRLLRRIAVPDLRNLNSLAFVGNVRLRLKGPQPYPVDITLSPDGRLLSRRVVEKATASAWYKLYPDPVPSTDGRRLLRANASGLEFYDATDGIVRTRIPEFEYEGENGLAATPGGFAVVRRNRDLRLFDHEGRLAATLIAFPGSGWAAWNPRGKAWGSYDGLPHLLRPNGDKLVPVTKGPR